MEQCRISDDPGDIAAVVVSRDVAADVWRGFFELWFRFWPDMPYPFYLISNHLDYPDPRVITLRTGDEVTWSQRVARALERVPNRYLLLSTDDFYLSQRVDTDNIRRLHALMVKKGAAYLRLMPYPPADEPLPESPDIGVIRPGALYRASLHMSFWDRSTFLSLLDPKESPVDFEIAGSRRSDAIADPFLGVCADVWAFNYYNAVRVGKWARDAVAFCDQIGLRLDLSKRPMQTAFDVWWHTPSPLRSALSVIKRALVGTKVR